jgi:hypothetical protein
MMSRQRTGCLLCDHPRGDAELRRVIPHITDLDGPTPPPEAEQRRATRDLEVWLQS